jgi:hypothetical protein
MKLPTCPEHDNLVLDLARGRLNDTGAMEAESVRETCPICSKWWNTTFADSDTAGVNGAVAQVFADFSPVAGRRRGWLAVAAAAVLAVGVGTTTMLWRNGDVDHRVAEQGPAADVVLSTWDFEDGEAASNIEIAAVPTPRDRSEAGEAVFVNDLESGDLGSWSFHS